MTHIIFYDSNLLNNEIDIETVLLLLVAIILIAVIADDFKE